ncbi:MAG: hypothetical protein KAX69_07945 [Chitinophagales bacterium]|nr:hypothetical protein [Chitinophagales bacterium]
MDNKNTYKMISGMFDYQDAECAYQHLIERGYTNDDINLLMTQDTHKIHFINEEVTTAIPDKSLSRAEVGAAIGGTGGALAGTALALAISLTIPGLGFVVAGTILAGIAGTTAGILAGGMIGALTGIGIPQDIALLYEKGIRDGKIVMSVSPKNKDDAEFIKNDWLMCNAKELHL